MENPKPKPEPTNEEKMLEMMQIQTKALQSLKENVRALLVITLLAIAVTLWASCSSALTSLR